MHGSCYCSDRILISLFKYEDRLTLVVQHANYGNVPLDVPNHPQENIIAEERNAEAPRSSSVPFDTDMGTSSNEASSEAPREVHLSLYNDLPIGQPPIQLGPGGEIMFFNSAAIRNHITGHQLLSRQK
ncbi:hypothetical protein FRC17_006064 [Serendipita sp. 399]|nr:hypothetical protein FRC17_006064 [Serendipita sp. 399]